MTKTQLKMMVFDHVFLYEIANICTKSSKYFCHNFWPPSTIVHRSILRFCNQKNWQFFWGLGHKYVLKTILSGRQPTTFFNDKVSWFFLPTIVRVSLDCHFILVSNLLIFYFQIWWSIIDPSFRLCLLIIWFPVSCWYLSSAWIQQNSKKIA